MNTTLDTRCVSPQRRGPCTVLPGPLEQALAPRTKPSPLRPSARLRVCSAPSRTRGPRWALALLLPQGLCTKFFLHRLPHRGAPPGSFSPGTATSLSSSAPSRSPSFHRKPAAPPPAQRGLLGGGVPATAATLLGQPSGHAPSGRCASCSWSSGRPPRDYSPHNAARPTPRLAEPRASANRTRPCWQVAPVP